MCMEKEISAGIGQIDSGKWSEAKPPNTVVCVIDVYVEWTRRKHGQLQVRFRRNHWNKKELIDLDLILSSVHFFMQALPKIDRE